MDIHPTPFPGKNRRSAAKPAAKEVENKSSRRPPWQSTVANPSKTKRTFGTIRNSNSIVEKPLPAKPALNKTSKVSKPVKPPVPAATKIIAADGECDAKKGHHVTFIEPEEKHETIDEEVVDGKEDVACTPIPSRRVVELPTPFFTAENCSKCRLDQLESTAYWLDQIKVAESVGKHFVSANFFRLALECHAQPLHRLRGELRYYVARHRVNPEEPIWVEVFRAYGMLKQKAEDVLDINFNSVDGSLSEKENLMLELDGDLCNIEQTGAFLVELDDSETKSDEKLENDETCENECLKHRNVDNLVANGEPREDDENQFDNSADTEYTSDEKLENNESNDPPLPSKIEANDNSSTPSATVKKLDSSSGKSKSSDGGSKRNSATSKGGVSKESRTPRSGASSGKKPESVSGKKGSSGISAKSTTRINRSGALKDKEPKDGSGNKKLNEKKQISPHFSRKDQLQWNW